MASDKWWSYPCEADNGKVILTTGHDGMQKYMDSGKYIYRLDVTWAYDALENGMPDSQSAILLEKITDAFAQALAKDKVAVMTGIYTGDGKRDWIFYTKNLKVFNNFFNRALADLPVMPFSIEASEDPDWEEYRHLYDTTYIPDEE